MRLLYYFKPRHYWSILIAQVVLLFLAAFMKDHPVLYALYVLSLFGIFGSVIMTIWSSRLPRVLAVACMVVAVVAGDMWIIPGMGKDAIMAGIVVALFAYAGFAFISIIAMLKNVFINDRVTTDLIVGSICIYLMVGVLFAFIYAALDVMDPTRFNFGYDAEPNILAFREYLYFSYTTLTTLGYGDMIPMSPVSRLLTSLEAMIGPVYLAIMVARLVGMHISQSARSGSKE